ncbi:MAG: aspartate aminotransferase family protein [Coriobacteriia bacterium]|nr:aspartate aminotransferase family protein [Coriobacteriia bacterium]
MDFQSIKSLEQNYLMNTYKRFDIALKNGSGSTLYDYEGKDYIDFSSGIGVNALGQCYKPWIEAIYKQAQTLGHTSNLFSTLPAVQLGEKLCELSKMSKVFFSNSGAESNEGAIKIARKYSYERYKSKRYTIISLVNSFHGRTISTLAATGQDVFHNYFFPFTEGFKFVEANNIKALEDALTPDVCAVLMEPIQGEGGVYPLEKEYLLAVQELCNKHDVLFMLDEVQTGVGRTGYFYAFQAYDLKPDVVSSSKALGGGLPFGAVLVNEKCKDVLGPGDHATTFGANPIVCAGALELIATVGQDEFLQSVREKGAYIVSKIESFRESHPQSPITGIRAQGLMIGIEVDADLAALSRHCIEAGVLCLTAGKQTIRLLPPLNISYDEIDLGLSRMLSVMSNSEPR